MPKFANACQNPLHNCWNENEEDFKVINLRAHGLGDVLKVYKALEADRGKCGRPQHIVNSCCLCLQKCLKKDEFKCNLTKDLQISLNEKVNY